MWTRKALIICEGYEEEACHNRLCGCGVWNTGITVEVENAKSENAKSGNVKPLKPGDARSDVSVCKDKFAMGDYAVVILCDTEALSRLDGSAKNSQNRPIDYVTNQVKINPTMAILYIYQRKFKKIQIKIKN